MFENKEAFDMFDGLPIEHKRWVRFYAFRGRKQKVTVETIDNDFKRTLLQYVESNGLNRQ